MKATWLGAGLIATATAATVVVLFAFAENANRPAPIAFEMKSGWRQTVPYSLGDWTFAEDGFWFPETEFYVDDAGRSETRSTRIERAGATTGERVVVASGPGFIGPNHITPEYLIGAYSTLSIINRKTGTQAVGGEPSANIFVDAMIDGQTVYALQRRLRNSSGTYTDMFLMRFDTNSMASLGETKLPHLTDQARFLKNEIVGVGPTRVDKQSHPCPNGMTCHFTLFRTGLDGKVRSQLVLQAKKRSDAIRGCLSTIDLVAEDKIFLDAGCGTYLAIDAGVSRVIYALPWSKVDTTLELALAGGILLARPENAMHGYGEKQEIQPVEAFDVESGRSLGTAMLPPGKLRTMKDKVAIVNRSRDSEIVVLVYDIKVAR